MKNLLYILCLFTFQFAFAQSELPEGFGDYRTIPKDEIKSGRVFCVGFIPPKFQEFVWKDSVLLLDQNRHVLKGLKLGEDYIIQTETVLIKPEYINWTFEEPEFEKIVHHTEQVIIKNEKQKIGYSNYYNVGDTITIERTYYKTPSVIIPKRKKLNQDVISMPKENLIVWAFVDFSTFTEQQVVRKREEELFFETIADTVDVAIYEIKTAKIYEATKQLIPAQIDTFQTIHFFNNVSFDNLQFTSIVTFRMIESGIFRNEWRQISGSHTYYTEHYPILEVQEALKERGYDVPTNGILGKETRAALLQFQKDNNLRQGQFDKYTLDALGVKIPID